MPEFLEKKLKAEYGNNPKAIYGTMNKIGAMHGNKITAKGEVMEKKHEGHMSEMRIQIHRGGDGKVTGHTVHHEFMAKPGSKSGAFMERPPSESHVFGKTEGKAMKSHVMSNLPMAEGPKNSADAGSKEEAEEEVQEGY